MKIVQSEVYRYRLPLKAPLALATGILTEREGLLLKLETDYSMEDMAQLETRVQAFLEVLVGAGAAR